MWAIVRAANAFNRVSPSNINSTNGDNAPEIILKKSKFKLNLFLYKKIFKIPAWRAFAASFEPLLILVINSAANVLNVWLR